MGSPSKLQEAFRLFDEANSQDPNTEVENGVEQPKELLYAKRMTQILDEFAPDAPEALQLTARCQHICRWEIPRDSYEMNRVGYLKWRQDLKKFHAEKASELLAKVGYDQETIDRVEFLLLKKQLKKDEDTQTLEDVICLVFLKYYYEPFLHKHDEAKLISILQKTWKKMSDKGHEAALKLPLSEDGLALVTKALSTT
ncbi:DUF4202 domain-containing protein [Allomuricauda sp. NBRC 101325]|uniref:DUF4202 domain-containing protein n=1 Tax=Allomuricauda sp. NBRC 101325 TaxID=1113758 RepID=UPI0024A430A2|nr:DUF4202 domain-containing protein [Muricauda sp. NBRC 101325]GLU42737.1 hypothetical protein Musp01_03610 [Muricauda sp. NBRC 101325]